MIRILLNALVRATASFKVVTLTRVHYAYTMDGALDWARQYPASFGPVFITCRRTRKTIAIRRTVEA